MKMLKMCGMFGISDGKSDRMKVTITSDIVIRYTADKNGKTLSIAYEPKSGEGVQITVPAEQIIDLLKRSRA